MNIESENRYIESKSELLEEKGTLRQFLLVKSSKKARDIFKEEKQGMSQWVDLVKSREKIRMNVMLV